MKRFPFVTLYCLLLLGLVIASWLVGLYGVDAVNSLLSGEGLRWWMRSVLPSFAAAPVGEALLLLFALGIVRRSCRRWNGKAFAWAFAVFAVLMGLLLWGTTSGTLLSAMGRWAHSPLAAAWLPVAVALVAIPCLCYGLTDGAITTRAQLERALRSEVARCASALLALFVASQLTAIVEYSGLAAVCGISAKSLRVIALVLYWAPFIAHYIGTEKKNKTKQRI